MGDGKKLPKLPDLTFELTRAEFLDLTDGREDLAPGCTALFAADIGKIVTEALKLRFIETVGLTGDFELEYKDATAMKKNFASAIAPNGIFAVVLFKNGRIRRGASEEPPLVVERIEEKKNNEKVRRDSVAPGGSEGAPLRGMGREPKGSCF